MFSDCNLYFHVMYITYYTYCIQCVDTYHCYVSIINNLIARSIVCHNNYYYAITIDRI